MSHADGLAILPDGEKYHFEYSGTMDTCCTRLYKDYDEMHENWRKNNEKKCICKEKKYTKVALSTTYGNLGFLWFSTICEKCLCITGKISDDEE